MRFVPHLLALSLGLSLAGCITTPHIAPTALPVEGHVDLGLTAAVAPVPETWWLAYRDSQLDRLLQEALADSPTLQQALARVNLAQAVVATSGAARWPDITYDAQLARERLSGKYDIPPPYAGKKVWLGNEGMNFSWELDSGAGNHRSCARLAVRPMRLHSMRTPRDWP